MVDNSGDNGTSANGHEQPPESLAARIDDLVTRATYDRLAMDHLEERHLADFDGYHYLREGVGPAVWVYVEGRTGGRMYRFSPGEYDTLEQAMNQWLECFAHCHGVDLEAAFSLREAAELLVQTRNIHDVGELLTGVKVPERE